MSVFKMKKTGIKLVLFLMLFLLIDNLAGLIFDYMIDETTNNKTGRLIHDVQDDVVIFGSSRSQGTYSPLILQDTLGLSAYNYGTPGEGIVLMYARMKLLAAKHVPKIVIYDIYPQFDIMENDNSKYISLLKPISSKKIIKDYINEVCPKEKYKMVSSLYRYNSNFMEVLKSYLTRSIIDSNNGYIPSFGHVKFDKNVNQTSMDVKVDSVKYHCMESFIREYKDKTKLLFVFSPRFKELDNSDSALKELFDKYDVTYLDCQQMEPYFSDKEYWNDGIHMNVKGSTEFTKYIASVVKQSQESR